MVNRKKLKRKKTRWGLHSVITMDGTPYCIFQEWELWQLKTRKNTGGRSITTIPSGNVRMKKLTDVLDEQNRTEITEELLDEV